MSENGKKPTVVVIDDEDIVVTSIKAFLELDAEFDVHTFTDPAESEKFFESHQVDVAVSDYRMPQMNGLKLLKHLKETQPESSRVLLTSHADANSAIEAINQVSLFQYREKPWDNEQLLLVVRSGIERSRLLRDLREKVEALDSAHATLKNAQKRLIHAFL
jgi:DNA-binding NtrC family response regulator